MFRESGFAFCISKIFPMSFKSCVEVSVGSSYIKFVTIGACQFINSLPVIFVILFHFMKNNIYIYILKYIKQQYCELCCMVVKHGLLH